MPRESDASIAAILPPMLAERLTAQLLAGPPAGGPARVAERLLAVQGQDPRGVRLAIRARTSGGSVADFDRALGEERSVLISWLNRGTLHLVRREDYPWLHALTTPQLLTGNARRLAQEGVTPAAAGRGVDVMTKALDSDGPQTRAQLAAHISAAGVRTEGQALVHILMLACLRGIAVRGPMIGREHAYVLVRDWIGEPAPVDRDRALGELARRYLAGHGPAGDRDLAKWAGVRLRDARAGLDAIARELVQRPDGLVGLASRAPAAEAPPPRLLGSFDPLLLGWTSREPVVGAHEQRLVSGGIFRPFALVGGRAAATWSIRERTVELDPFARLAVRDRAALDADAAEVVRYLGA